MQLHHHVLTSSSRFSSLRRCYHVGKAASINSAIERNLRKFGPGAKAGDRVQRTESWKQSTQHRGGRLSVDRQDASFESRRGSSARSRTNNEAQSWNGHQAGAKLRPRKSSGFDNDNPDGKSLGNSRGPRAPATRDHLGKLSIYQKRPSSEAILRQQYRSSSDQQSPLKTHGSPSRSTARYSGDTRGRSWSGNPQDDGEAPSQSFNGRDGRKLEVSSLNDQKSTASFSAGASDRSRASTLPRPASYSDKLPVSVPYTTPASEFLYGTSVVEAALRSQRTPRRKLYKLYIYNGENREVGERDDQLERVARKNGVQVVRLGNEGLRLMEKLSSGRPHNGYILEASPIPRMPVESLGQQVVRGGQIGYFVTVGHQSREEAVVNGTSDFQPTTSSHGKMPFVLLLDGIIDPGNMGGILRTASFLGASAVAISTRNSAPFTPVVLKASAGASENMTLFSVSSPAAFVVESQRAGWKLFAGVAPSNDKGATNTKTISIDDLGDPLTKSPCILMLGSEGAGLRWNLRSKADVELYIPGCDQTYNVDSLNVGVAAGILCSAFLQSRSAKVSSPDPISKAENSPILSEDLF